MQNHTDKDFIYADAHCDTVQATTPWRLAYGSRSTQLDFVRLCDRARLQFMAYFLGADVMSQPAEEAWRRLRQQELDLRFAVQLCPNVELLTDFSRAGEGDRVQLVAAIEGLDFLAGDYRRVDELYDRGIRSFGLFWNHDSFLGSGAMAPADRGLTGAGRELVRHLAANGWLVDLAHAGKRSFWQAADILSSKPLFVSHCCVAALCDHPRNLDDRQIRAVGESGGLLGLTLVPAFLSADGLATPADVARHAAYAAGLVGAEHLAIGSDFDGTDTLPAGINGVQDVGVLYKALLDVGFNVAEAEGIMGKNLLRFLKNFN